MRNALIFATLVLALAAGCRKENTSARRVTDVLPAGDPIAGKKAFQEMRCWSCHEIYGDDMPRPVASPPMPVYLGGNAVAPPDEIHLLQEIVAPSHELAPGWDRQAITSNGGSRMGEYSQIMTVRQLFDIIAFLRSRYGEGAEAAVRSQAGTS
jgi:hypothetical protein